MTQEDKAKAYDKAIEEAFAAYKDEDRHLKATLERIFPKLKESGDERIRKALIEMFNVDGQWHGIQYKEILAWLEKQGEQKTKENEELRLDCIKNLEQQDTLPTSIYAEWLKSLRPQKQWKPSDEQMQYLLDATYKFNEFSGEHAGLIELYKQLKKLREE